MDSFWIGITSAIWLGILTSISPCPLATNIAAISYIGKNLEQTRRVLFAGLLYLFGRVLAYVILAIILVSSLSSIYETAGFLDRSFNKILGPALIVVGIMLLGIFKFAFSGSILNDKMQKRVDSLGLWGAGLLGILFALSFCPVSAALFFGSLIPLSMEYQSSVIMPLMYGLGTGLPVFIFALAIGMGTGYVGKIYNKINAFEKWARYVTGIIFILVGTYYVLVYIFGVSI